MPDERFSRTLALLGEASYQGLRSARIAIFGLGGVGSFCAEYLARSGAERLWLFDFDRITPSSCNRLLYAGSASLGQEKAQTLKERIQEINPQAAVVAQPLFIANENAREVLTGDEFDLVIDAIDSLNPKLALLETALELKLRVISSMGAAARLDPSRVRRADLWETSNCPLAVKVRQGLRRRGITAPIPAVFSDEPPLPPLPPEADNQRDAELRYPRGRVRNIQPSGAWIPAVFGAQLFYLALETLELLPGSGGRG